MNPFHTRWVGLSTLALALAGCEPREGDRHARNQADREEGLGHASDPGVSFSAQSGLWVPTGTAEFIGLEVAEVEERTVASAFRFTASIYRAAPETGAASTPPIMPTPALASAMLAGTDAALLRGGQRVSAEADGGGALAGRIMAVNHDAAEADGQAEVLLAIEDKQAKLAQGAFVTVHVPLGSDQPVMSVPRSALLQTTEGHFVYTASGEHFVRAPVKLGLANRQYAEITDGLYAGDRIVVKPVLTLWLAELQSLRGGKACADGH